MSSSTVYRPRIPHVPALDGLRGLALAAVLLFHADGLLPGGYLGVDLFFVLSGFLITSILLAEHRATGRIALSSFCARRARRLFPALLSLMPAIAIYGRYFARPDELESLRAQALATLAYAANWHAISDHHSYWRLFAAPSPLEHTWSLSIEEQFYLLWPPLLVLVLRRGSPRAVRALALVLATLSVAAMTLLFEPENTTRVYMGTDTRMAALLAGAALATWLPLDSRPSAQRVRRLDIAGVLAALILGSAWVRLDGANWFLYHGGFWLAELAALLLIVCAVAGQNSLISQVLSVRPLRWLGTISYGAYLWHWPVNVFLSPERAHLHGFALHVARFAITFAIAALSYRFVERPILKNGVPFGRPHYIVPAAILTSVLLIVRATYAREGSAPSTERAVAPIAAGAPTVVRYRVALFGDSTANSLGWGLRGLHEKNVAIDLLGKDGCTLFGDSCDAEHWAERVRELHPDATLVYLAGAFLHGFGTGGGWQHACHHEWDAKFEHALTRRLRELAAENTRVFALTVPYPVARWDTGGYRAQVDCINRSLRKAATAVPGVRMLEVAEKLCPKGICELETREQRPIRPDGVHFSLDGARSLSRWVFDSIVDAR